MSKLDENSTKENNLSVHDTSGLKVDTFIYSEVKKKNFIDFVKSKEFHFCYVRLLRYKFKIITLFFAGLVSSFLNVSIIVLLNIFLQQLIGDSNTDTDTKSIAGFQIDINFIHKYINPENTENFIFVVIFVVILMASLLMFWQRKEALSVQNKFIKNVREEVFDRLLKFNMSYFTSSKLGDIAYIQNTVVNRFSQFVPFVQDVFVSIVSTILIIIVLFKMSYILTIGLTVFSVIIFIAMGSMRRKSSDLSFNSSESSRIAGSTFLEIVYGIRLIIQGGQEKWSKGKYLVAAETKENDALIFGNHVNKIKAMSEILGSIGLVVFIYIFGLFFSVDLGESVGMTIGYFIAAWGALIYLYKSINHSSQLNQLIPFLTIVYNYLNDKTFENDAESSSRKLKNIRTSNISSISLSNMHFSYDNKEAILKDFSYKFTKGKIYAVVGLSGSGKSSLLEILGGVHSHNKGCFYVNGDNIKNISMSSYRSSVGYVNQDPIIFNTTIKDNVTFFNKNASEEFINSSLEMSLSRQFVFDSIYGIDSPVGEKGLKLSGGQRQRISLARVLMQDSKVMLLDEATSALDLRTESEIYKNLQKIKEDKIIIVVAHRLSAITKFDNIIVLNNGSIFEEGSHAELMGKKNLYYDLFKIQEIGGNYD